VTLTTRAAVHHIADALLSVTLQTYEYRAGMTCDGCANAISRILSKTPGVNSFTTNVAEQKVIVKGSASQEMIYQKLNKWATAAKKDLQFVKEL